MRDGEPSARLPLLAPEALQPGRAPMGEEPEAGEDQRDLGGTRGSGGIGSALDELFGRLHGTCTHLGAFSAPLTITRNGRTSPELSWAIGNWMTSWVGLAMLKFPAAGGPT